MLIEPRMRIKICAECYKALYPNRGRETIVCPQCLSVMNDRRSARRTKEGSRLMLGIDGSLIPALAVDSSVLGLGIVYESEPLENGLSVTVRLNGKDRQAVVVWSKRINRGLSAAGLKVV